jgi:hypothetical protein
MQSVCDRCPSRLKIDVNRDLPQLLVMDDFDGQKDSRLYTKYESPSRLGGNLPAKFPAIVYDGIFLLIDGE